MSISNPRQTFLNPTVPFAGTILGGLLPGEMMLLQGSIPKDADRFQIDLTCGSSVSPRADVAFHFNPRLGRSPCVVTNSLQGGKWGKEEIHYNSPFRQDQAYEILLLVLKDSFKVAVNGAHVLEYKQRVDLDRVDTVCISGKVNVEAVGILPSSAPDSPSVSLSSDSQMNPITSSSGDLSVPFSGQLINGLTVGRSVTIRAELHPHADKFGVDLCAGADIALHLNPRLKKRSFVRNSELSGSWGPEEKKLAGAFPFSPGTYFEMIVLCDAQQFKVAVNGLHLFDFHHRVRNLKRITSISVFGDVTLLDVKIL